MDDINIKIELKSKTGKIYTFIHRYDLTANEEPKSTGIYVFVSNENHQQPAILDVLFLSVTDNLSDTVKRMKEEEGAAFAFVREGDNELLCDADIDDIKGGEDFKKFIE